MLQFLEEWIKFVEDTRAVGLFLLTSQCPMVSVIKGGSWSEGTEQAQLQKSSGHVAQPWPLSWHLWEGPEQRALRAIDCVFSVYSHPGLQV